MKKLLTILIALLLLLSAEGQILRYSNYVAPTPSTVLVESIDVFGTGGATTISTNGGTLQMLKKTLPTNATDTTATWSRINGTGTANISAGGLLTALTNGTVTARATANDGSAVYGEEEITISNQAEPAVYTDNFNSYSAGSLAGQGNWVAAFGTFVVMNSEIRCGTPAIDEDAAIYYNQPLNNNQYSQVRISTITGTNYNSYIGVSVRASSNTWYGLSTSNTGTSFYKVVSGTPTTFYYDAGITASVNDVFKLTANGTNIIAYKNDEVLWNVTDSDINTGYAGLCGYGLQDVTDYVRCDDWEGGDL